jgi:hypothetical protein
VGYGLDQAVPLMVRIMAAVLDDEIEVCIEAAEKRSYLLD